MCSPVSFGNIVEKRGYRVSDAQRWARWLFIFLGVVTLIIWIVPLLSFWNTYHCLDLRHSGVGVAPDQASAWATGVVTVGWFMFSVWAVPQIKSLFWSYIFFVIGISHLGFAMGIFLFIRLSPAAASFFLKTAGEDDGEEQTSSQHNTSSSSLKAKHGSENLATPTATAKRSSSATQPSPYKSSSSKAKKSASKAKAQEEEEEEKIAAVVASPSVQTAVPKRGAGKKSATPPPAPTSAEDVLSNNGGSSRRATRSSTRRARDSNE